MVIIDYNTFNVPFIFFKRYESVGKSIIDWSFIVIRICSVYNLYIY